MAIMVSAGRFKTRYPGYAACERSMKSESKIKVGSILPEAVT
jgi:hypothetical protein